MNLHAFVNWLALWWNAAESDIPYADWHRAFGEASTLEF